MLFYKINTTGHIEYVVANIDSVFQTSTDKDSFLDDLMVLQHEVLRYAVDVPGLSIELAMYNLTVSDRKTKIRVPNIINNSFDELTAESDSLDENICFGVEPVQLSKLHICPYIKLRTGEIPMKIELDFLLFTDPDAGNAVIKTLSRWEYEMEGDSIKICLKDYLIINNAISRSHTNLPSSATTIFINRLSSPGLRISLYLYFTIKIN